MIKHKSSYVFLAIFLIGAWFFGRFNIYSKKEDFNTKVKKDYKEIFKKEMPEKVLKKEKKKNGVKATSSTGWTYEEILEIKKLWKNDKTIIDYCNKLNLDVNKYIDCYTLKMISKYSIEEINNLSNASEIEEYLKKSDLACREKLQNENKK